MRQSNTSCLSENTFTVNNLVANCRVAKIRNYEMSEGSEFNEVAFKRANHSQRTQFV